jgi:uncharacterized protein (DUF3820 family)
MVSDLKTKMWFGKYKGQTIEQVLDMAPGYLLWAHRSTDVFRMTDELLDRAELLNDEDESWTQDGYTELDLAFKEAYEED